MRDVQSGVPARSGEPGDPAAMGTRPDVCVPQMKRALTGLMGAAAIAAVALAPTAPASPGDTFLLVPRDITPGIYLASIQPGHDYGLSQYAAITPVMQSAGVTA
jgi:hypothetical protein